MLFLGYFFKILFERFVDTKSIHCRLDLVAVGSQPGQYIDQLSKLIGQFCVYLYKIHFKPLNSVFECDFYYYKYINFYKCQRVCAKP